MVGLGAHGSAALYHLSQEKGLHVIGFDRFDPPHTKGSAHGETRLIRYAYGEGDHYVPLLLAARDNWRALEKASGEDILFECGRLQNNPPDINYFKKSLAAARKNDLPHEVIDGRTTRKRFPGFNVPDGSVTICDHTAGYLMCEKAIQVHLNMARKKGVQVVTNTAVKWNKANGFYILQSEKTDQPLATADKIILTNGAWFPASAPLKSTKTMKISRLTLHWFKPLGDKWAEHYAPDNFATFQIFESDTYVCYGTPLINGYLKIGRYHYDRDKIKSPNNLNREITPQDIDDITYWVKSYLPGLHQKPSKSVACMTTYTSDEDFILGPSPQDEGIILGHACAGHGFKFSSVIGEILSDLAIDGKTKYDLSHHSPMRFSSHA